MARILFYNTRQNYLLGSMIDEETIQKIDLSVSHYQDRIYFFDPDELDPPIPNRYMFCYEIEKDFLELVRPVHHDVVLEGSDFALTDYGFIYFYADLDTSTV